jgi:type IV secretory pathway VirB10-like protein
MKSESNPHPTVSIAADLKKIRRNTAASSQEIREFLAQMRGKSPQEMLGMLASSSLVKCTTQAAIGWLVVIAVFTLGPWLWSLMNPVAAKVPQTPSPAAAVVPTAPAEPKPSNPAPPAKAAEKLGIGETKEAPPTQNPLEKASDDLLKDLKN